MFRRTGFTVLAALLVAATAVRAEPTTAEREPATQAAEPGKTAASGGFKQDVKRAWSDTRAGVHRTGREIGAGARSFGRATRDAFRSGWHKMKEGFAGTPEQPRSQYPSSPDRANFAPAGVDPPFLDETQV